ncbi:conserved hypothetical protein [Aspergillus terreus NIH2624]|uniref:Exonuclease V, mitochondrial n=1 Tax=Aspergillus terreus (strain NIH 2624 / FGSC A1156) TaxID=341663 RepID=Q0D0E5_ASPTN|nr:uncharacterized protein ATEG_00589 [Aspergillus terreus NIH2624]EAU39235.1 conserved hypothetical protein [Aspergillus terreus NIH2624]
MAGVEGSPRRRSKSRKRDAGERWYRDWYVHPALLLLRVLLAFVCGHRPVLSGERERLVEHPDSTEGRERERERDVARERAWTADATAPGETDVRSPIERFRKPPNKAFSVTDLISPAWCELQYWYTLTKHGRKRRTAAMKQGSTIHKTLEDEVHTTVPIEITTKEDAMALRIWNVIQGLRTLREFGITRELEVWGLVDGELVNGVIDQLSYECPDAELEASAASFYADVEASRAVMPEYQMSLTDYLLSPSQGGKRLSDISWNEENQRCSDEPSSSDPHSSQGPSETFDMPRVYLTDIKTRASNSVPTVKSTSFRPTLLQLQMYYHMLNRLITSEDVSIELLASRYNLDAERTFTDAFIAEVGGLNDQFFDALSTTEFDPDFIPSPEDVITRRPSHADASSAEDGPPGSQDSTSVLLAHNNLSSLWKLMKDQLRLTFIPDSSSAVSVAPSIPSEFQPHILEPYQTLISPLLTARYLSSEPTADLRPRVLGSRSFLFDPTTMTSYLSDQMEWWRGQRDPRGVEVMEAWKCRICEFREEFHGIKEVSIREKQRYKVQYMAIFTEDNFEPHPPSLIPTRQRLAPRTYGSFAISVTGSKYVRMVNTTAPDREMMLDVLVLSRRVPRHLGRVLRPDAMRPRQAIVHLDEVVVAEHGVLGPQAAEEVHHSFLQLLLVPWDVARGVDVGQAHAELVLEPPEARKEDCPGQQIVLAVGFLEHQREVVLHETRGRHHGVFGEGPLHDVEGFAGDEVVDSDGGSAEHAGVALGEVGGPGLRRGWLVSRCLQCGRGCTRTAPPGARWLRP